MKRERIIWIDIAKAIAIICMIIGHLVPLGSPIRNLIYSFHMPLFFILTGYTMKRVNSFSDVFEQIKKDSKHILVPYFAIYALDKILGIVLQGEYIDFYKCIETLVWSSAVEVKDHPLIGAIWFLNALFWTKILYNVIQIVFRSSCSGIIYLMFALLGQLLAIRQEWMPLSFDIVFTATMYIYIGQILKAYWDFIESKQQIISILLWGVWMFCWNEGMYVEMATRYYPHFPASVLMSVCGCLSIFTLCKAVENNVYLSTILSNIGKHTLLILGIHHLSYRFSFLWGYNTGITCLIALIFAIGLAQFIVVIRRNVITIIKK